MKKSTINKFKKEIDIVINDKIIDELSLMINEEDDVSVKSHLILLQLRFLDKRDKLTSELNNL